MRRSDLEAALRPLLDGTHPEPFVTVRLPERGAHVQFLHEGGTLDLFLNTSGDGGSLDQLRSAVAGLGLEVHRLDGLEGTEHVTLGGPEAEPVEKALEVLSAVFERPGTDEAVRLGSPNRRWTSELPAAPMRRALALSSLGLVIAGSLAIGAALVHTRVVSGAWFASPRPTPVDVALGLGSLGLLFGGGIGLYWALLQLSDRTALGDLLHRPLVGDSNSVTRTASRAIRGVVSLRSGYRAIRLLAAVVLVLWFAFYEPLIAWILGLTAIVLVLVYGVGRRGRWG